MDSSRDKSKRQLRKKRNSLKRFDKEKKKSNYNGEKKYRIVINSNKETLARKGQKKKDQTELNSIKRRKQQEDISEINSVGFIEHGKKTKRKDQHELNDITRASGELEDGTFNPLHRKEEKHQPEIGSIGSNKRRKQQKDQPEFDSNGLVDGHIQQKDQPEFNSDELLKRRKYQKDQPELNIERSSSSLRENELDEFEQPENYIGQGHLESNEIAVNLVPPVEAENVFENGWITYEISELRKDVNATNIRFDKQEKELKQIKKILKNKTVFPSLLFSSRYEEEEDFSLLPKIPLKKLKKFYGMETNINSDNEYKRQVVKRMSSIGGNDIKENMINIFKQFFSARLRTKMCWRGSTKGKGKIAFQHFKGVQGVLRQAISARFDCTDSIVQQECKLRFKQADKDYEREKEKKLRLQQIVDNEQ